MRYLLILLLSGCATVIDLQSKPPNDWPELEVRVVRATQAEAIDACKLSVSFADVVRGCAIANFYIGRCYIFLVSDDPSILEHEKLHCIGYDHPGESVMRDSWQKWKDKNH